MKNALLEHDILIPNSIFDDSNSDVSKRYLPSGGVAGQIWGASVPYKFVSGYRKFRHMTPLNLV